MERYIKMYKPTKNEYNAILVKNYELLKPKATIINEGQENEYIFVEDKYLDMFHITSVSREDFKGIGYDASKISDEEMEYLAEKLADYFCESGGFWDYLENYAIDNELPIIP